jgi:hypothetical protein
LPIYSATVPMTRLLLGYLEPLHPTVMVFQESFEFPQIPPSPLRAPPCLIGKTRAEEKCGFLVVSLGIAKLMLGCIKFRLHLLRHRPVGCRRLNPRQLQLGHLSLCKLLYKHQIYPHFSPRWAALSFAFLRNPRILFVSTAFGL